MILLGNVLRKLSRNRLSVFLFHKVPQKRDALFPADLDIAGFSDLLDFVQQHFQVLPLSEAVSMLVSGRLMEGAACITFDDGYHEWTTGVVPLLEKRSLHATFFITTGQFFGLPMWHERLSNIVGSATGDVLDTSNFRLPPLPVRTLDEKRAAIIALEFHFKYLPIVIRDKYLLELEAATGARAENVQSMNVEQLRDIAGKGFDIGSHTVEHPILSLCESVRGRREIGEAKEVLEGIIRSKVSAFAYPNGRPWLDFTHQHISMVKQLGYTHALTTQWGAANKDTSLFQIPRFTPWGPGQNHMALQVVRNLLEKPEYIKEAA